MMSLEYDLHPYNNPGMESNVYWASPKWWVPLSPGRPLYTPAFNTAKDLHQVPGGQGILTNLLKVFRNKRRKVAAQQEAVEDGDDPRDAAGDEGVIVEATLKDTKDNQGEESNKSTVEKEEVGDEPPSPTGDLEDLDLEVALTALFAEATRIGDGDLIPTLEAALRLEAPGADESCPASSPGRTVKFADDLGLPLTAVLVFEGEEEDEEEEGRGEGEGEEGTAEEGGKRSRRFRLTKRKRRAVSLHGSPKTTEMSYTPEHNYQRYYKPYMDDYDTRRVNATGAFSMVGF